MAALLAVGGVGCSGEKAAMQRIPSELQAAEIVYENEESWGVGFMPGDNETGVVAYSLPNATVDRIATEGIGFFDRLSGRWADWSETPVVLDRDWSAAGAFDPNVEPLQRFLERHGFGIDVDPKVARAINHAVSTKGSFYKHLRGGGVILVAPAARMAYLFYAG